MTRVRKGWWRDRRGVAALEFALVCPLLLLLFGGLVDLGMTVWSESCLANAVAQGAQFAYRTQQTGTNVTQMQIRTFVQQVSTLSGVDASSTTAPAYYCLNTTASPPTLDASASGATCATPTYDGSKAGLYVHIIATYTQSAQFPLFTYMVNKTVTESTWVRLL